jgi:single-strand DNA-binding protein
MTDINSVVLCGRLVRDAEIKSLQSGSEVANFSIAVNRSIKQGDAWVEQGNFFEVSRFRPGGLAQYLTKGQQVVVSGELVQDRWQTDGGENRSKVKVLAHGVQLVGSKGNGSQTGGAGSPAGDNCDDDVPF